MKTFKWTVPEFDHEGDRIRNQAAQESRNLKDWLRIQSPYAYRFWLPNLVIILSIYIAGNLWMPEPWARTLIKAVTFTCIFSFFRYRQLKSKYEKS